MVNREVLFIAATLIDPDKWDRGMCCAVDHAQRIVIGHTSFLVDVNDLTDEALEPFRPPDRAKHAYWWPEWYKRQDEERVLFLLFLANAWDDLPHE